MEHAPSGHGAAYYRSGTEVSRACSDGPDQPPSKVGTLRCVMVYVRYRSGTAEWRILQICYKALSTHHFVIYP
jgi:hypothetical protein